MTAALIPTPVMQFLDADGNPLVGGKVYTYAAGTSTPLATYTDYGGATPNANPVILDSRGEASIWFGTAAYKLELYTAATVLIWTADNVSASTPVVYGTGVAAALAINVGTAGSILVNGGVLGTPSSGLVTNLTGTASININGTVGATTATTGAFTTLSASGTTTAAAINASGTVAMAGAATVGTTLGVSGTASIGSGSATGDSLLKLQKSSGLTGANQFGVDNEPTFSSAATVAGYAAYTSVATQAAAFTMTNLYNQYIATPTIGAGSSVTNMYGLYIANILGAGTSNYAIYTNTGQVHFGGAVDLSSTLSVSGTSTMAAINASGVGTFNATASASSGSVMLTAADPTVRFNVTGGTADKSKYEWRALAAGGVNDYLQLRKINDANTVFTELLAISNAGILSLAGPLSITSANPGGWATGFRTVVDNNGGEARIYAYGADATTRGSFNFYSLEADGGNNGSVLSIAIGGVVTMPVYGAGAATFSAAGVISSVSDERLKIKDGVIADPIPMIMALEPGYYFGKPEANMGDGRQLGFYAQNVRKAIGPEAAPDPEDQVSLDKDGNEVSRKTRPWGYFDRSVLAVAIEALKVHEGRLAALQADFEAYKSSHP